MPNILLIVGIIFILTIVMSMSGRGGGNFYVITLVLAGVSMHNASTTSQFILIACALSGAIIFGKAKVMSWPLVLFFGGINAFMAFIGGLQAHLFSGILLKQILAFVLAIAGIAMLLPEKQTVKEAIHRLGYWNIQEEGRQYVINLWIAIPLTMLTGFFSGMVGISGGSFLVPLMVVGSGVPMKIAVGTASAMLAATALSGFLGNAIHGGFEPALAIPCAIIAVAGGIIGSKIALKSKPTYLKTISGVITIIAAVMMILNTLSK